jgi:hypothetical protein
VVAMEEGTLEVRVFCGAREAAEKFLKECNWHDLLPAFGQTASRRGELRNEDFVCHDSYWLLPLRSKDRASTLGILGVQATNGQPALTGDELATVATFVGQAELALEDMHLQQDVFAALRRIVPEIEELQRLRSAGMYAAPARLERLESNPVYAPDFAQVVRDALRHYWGGARLEESPLMRTRLVRQALPANDGIAARAVRSVLSEAIERLKPPGERSMTSSEWVVYNILEQKFVQGRAIREIVDRMAMSESDFYRKQRAAIEELAKALVAMELEQQG